MADELQVLESLVNTRTDDLNAEYFEHVHRLVRLFLEKRAQPDMPTQKVILSMTTRLRALLVKAVGLNKDDTRRIDMSEALEALAAFELLMAFDTHQPELTRALLRFVDTIFKYDRAKFPDLLNIAEINDVNGPTPVLWDVVEFLVAIGRHRDACNILALVISNMRTVDAIRAQTSYDYCKDLIIDVQTSACSPNLERLISSRLGIDLRDGLPWLQPKHTPPVHFHIKFLTYLLTAYPVDKTIEDFNIWRGAVIAWDRVLRQEIKMEQRRVEDNMSFRRRAVHGDIFKNNISKVIDYMRDLLRVQRVINSKAYLNDLEEEENDDEEKSKVGSSDKLLSLQKLSKVPPGSSQGRSRTDASPNSRKGDPHGGAHGRRCHSASSQSSALSRASNSSYRSDTSLSSDASEYYQDGNESSQVEATEWDGLIEYTTEPLPFNDNKYDPLPAYYDLLSICSVLLGRREPPKPRVLSTDYCWWTQFTMHHLYTDPTREGLERQFRSALSYQRESKTNARQTWETAAMDLFDGRFVMYLDSLRQIDIPLATALGNVIDYRKLLVPYGLIETQVVLDRIQLEFAALCFSNESTAKIGVSQLLWLAKKSPTGATWASEFLPLLLKKNIGYVQIAADCANLMGFHDQAKRLLVEGAKCLFEMGEFASACLCYTLTGNHRDIAFSVVWQVFRYTANSSMSENDAEICIDIENSPLAKLAKFATGYVDRDTSGVLLSVIKLSKLLGSLIKALMRRNVEMLCETLANILSFPENFPVGALPFTVTFVCSQTNLRISRQLADVLVALLDHRNKTPSEAGPHEETTGESGQSIEQPAITKHFIFKRSDGTSATVDLERAIPSLKQIILKRVVL